MVAQTRPTTLFPNPTLKFSELLCRPGDLCHLHGPGISHGIFID